MFFGGFTVYGIERAKKREQAARERVESIKLQEDFFNDKLVRRAQKSLSQAKSIVASYRLVSM